MPSFDVHNPDSKTPIRHALTLIEILVALTMTLILLGAMMAAFNFASDGMQERRSVMEMANRARSVEDQLRSDLDSLTVDPRPHTASADPPGYLEITERPRTDGTDFGGPNDYLGDVDDLLGMTIRSKNGVMFQGRRWIDTNANGIFEPNLDAFNPIESSLAEVVWFTSVVSPGTLATSNVPPGANAIDISDTVRLHRRQLLIRPDFGVIASGINQATVNALLSQTDVSCRVVPTSVAGQFDLVANDLTDLARRENRFAHSVTGFPTGVAAPGFPHFMTTGLIDARVHSEAEDIMLTDVAAFDIRVFATNADVVVDTGANLIIEPGDNPVAYANGVTNIGSTTLGAFVDLGHGATTGGVDDFSAFPSVGSRLTLGTTSVWDTWSPSYESDGIDQDDAFDGTAGIDQGTNGINDGGAAAPDDDSERETAPPYASPIRGLKITLRLIEKGTNTVFQTSVVQSYVPE